DLAFANVRINTVRGNQPRAEITNSNRFCEKIPDMSAHPVHPVAGAPLNAEGHNLVVDLGFDEAVSTHHNGGTSLERQIRQWSPKLRMNRPLWDASRMLRSSACSGAVSVVDEGRPTLCLIRSETTKSWTLPWSALVFVVLIVIFILHECRPV